ncbi:DUF4179 domain-containing protein [Virgibacillus necropolis]|uniref:DUF4179 domain-containing protein n=1 Tax=Virgibacillus necropolis TaxID=163877 RepID=A0A221MFD4_9BACI|nr:DUF4179 domain-containing protein [Virgibacillus necropolis]ASN06345.1 hypothetical protein CFK40_15615 [Virgibacillus necropolis]
MDKDKIRKHLDDAIEKQVPDVWDEVENRIHKAEESGYREKIVNPNNVSPLKKKKILYKRLSLAAAACLICIMTLTFTPVLAAIQEVYDKIFTSERIDDAGVRKALHAGLGQSLDQTYYDKEYDITVHFKSVLTDAKETKLLLTYQSDSTNLENYYIDLFEGVSSIQLITEDGQRQTLDNVGWGSDYYNSEENIKAEALSFESIKEYEGQEIRLEIEDLTIWDEGKGSVQTTWPLEFTLDESATSDRETVEVNKEFTFKNETYTIKHVEYSGLETRVVVTGSDIKPYIGPDGNKYHKRSKLERLFYNARKNDKELGYIVDEGKSGVFLESAGERVVPVFSKGEVESSLNEYIMFFAPVKDREDTILEVGDDSRIPLTE